MSSLATLVSGIHALIQAEHRASLPYEDTISLSDYG